jgi:dipeptidyl aminopeptidase/acylaminoacyl peptidase
MSVHEYGSWPSPLAAADVFRSSGGRGTCATVGGLRFWLHVRPDNDGRATLVRDAGDGPLDLTPPEHDVRTRFLEYGGAPYGVDEESAVYVDFASQRVWRVDGTHDPVAITPDVGGAVRFSCFRIDRRRGVAWCLREDQRDASLEPVTSLVRLALDGPNEDLGAVAVAGRERPVAGPELAADADSAPDFLLDHRLSPDGSRLAWVSWNHPNMPWHGTWLRTARIADDGSLVDEHVVAGAEDESVEQPRWVGDDRLLFLSDRTGWSNFWEVGVAGEHPTLAAETHDDTEYGCPRWVPGITSYDVLPDGRVATTLSREGRRELAVLDLATGEVTPVPTGLPYVAEVHALDADRVLVGTGTLTSAERVLVVSLTDGSTTPVVDEAQPDPGLVSEPRYVEWPVSGGGTASGFLYRPASPDPEVTAPPGTLPPLLVTLHGGPTSAAVPGFSRARAYWTSRGFAVLDVNYGGSTGFGRAFRERLEGQWGVVDVEDTLAGVRYLAEAGEIDGSRVLTRGGSAGGFTTLALLTGSDAFRAGCSLFGVSDCGALARDTHKLESRYLWRLVAPWPEGRALHEERSPINHLDDLTTPLLILQGSDDRVVPPDQAHTMADALREKGLPVAMIEFEGEGHGFRRPENQVRALEAELSFYTQVLGLPHPQGIEPVPVENL